MVVEIDAGGDDVCDNNGYSDHEVEDYNDLDQDKVPNDTDDEGANDDCNVNPNRGIVIRNYPRAHMSNIDPNAVQVSKFLEYPDIVPAQWLATDSKREELFRGQKFATKEECVFVIKRYGINLSVDYKVAVSKPTLYIWECWR
ncbi:hypothetical protein PVK06_024535 [Gossypium arboreum]|uniref:Uncharacterized protein n=1 Tax=Gossypium arboreum TaxID=29729 RepID=A0ABR0PE55_GOSAR|nr:hypothetical protein PVK06_024535 [Gossypium arboreum]